MSRGDAVSKKKTELGKRIEKVRGKMLQKDFASKVGLTQAGVSALEKGSRGRTASAGVYLRIARLAKEAGDRAFFIERAGFKPREIVSLANSLLSEQLIRPGSHEMVAIPRVRKVGDKFEEIGPRVPMLSEMIPNPAATYCFAVGAGSETRHWAVVDVTGADSDDVRQFLGIPVLMEFKEGYRLVRDPKRKPKGVRLPMLELGSLFLETGDVVPGYGALWLLRFLPEHPLSGMTRDSWPVGRWVEEDAALFMADLSRRCSNPEMVEYYRQLRVSKRIALSPQNQVIGSVIGRWTPPQEHLKTGFPWDKGSH